MSATFGLWTIERRQVEFPALRRIVGADHQTVLHRMTAETMHLPVGEIVMEDSTRELARHLPIWLLRAILRQGDAITMEWAPGTRWDFAWHDIWGEGAQTPLLHGQLFRRYAEMADRQGAWGMPRWFHRRAGGTFISIGEKPKWPSRNTRSRLTATRSTPAMIAAARSSL